MLVPQALAAVLANSARSSLAEWGNELANYLLQNTTFMCTWIAFMPAEHPVPDPMVAPIAAFTQLQINLTYCQSMFDLGMQIQAGCAQGMVNITGFQTAPVPFSIATPLILPLGYSVYPGEHLVKANAIIAWMKSWVVPAPFVGQHGPFIGSGNNITIM